MRSLISAAVIVLAVTVTLSACDAAEQVTGPDPQEAADALAAGLANGDLSEVSFAGSTPEEVTAELHAIVEGMGELEPVVEAGEVEEAGGIATTRLRWSWPVAGDEWSYETDVELTEADESWEVAWSRAVVEPHLREGSTLDVTPIGGARGPIMGAGGVALVTERAVVRVGIDRTQVPAARAGESARRLARLVDIDAAPYAKQVEAAGDEAFVEAIVYRKDEVPP
ncbi:MAG: NTF2-like N-terminal transpeptidase domain-containing protein, partial [Nocardioides sp.]